MDSLLCNTPLTGQKFINLLAKSEQLSLNNHQLIDIQAEILGDQGYTSKVFQINLRWSPEGVTLPKSVIVKTIGSDATDKLFKNRSKEDLNELKNHIKISHNVECAIYNLIELATIVPMPKCYAAIESEDDQLGIMILEDLKDQGNLLPKPIMFNIGLNLEQLEEILQTLTNVQTWSLNTKIDWRRSIPKQADNPAIPFASDLQRAALPQSKKEYPKLFEKFDDQKLIDFVNKQTYLDVYGNNPQKKYNLPSVLVHGDIQLLNMMFEKVANDQEAVGNRLIALLDWQLAHQGCGVEDLTRLFSWCLSTKTRKENGDFILRRYVELFNSKVDNPEYLITFENVKSAWNEMFSFASMMQGCSISSMTTYVSRLNGITEEERTLIKNKIIDRIIVNFHDSLEILGW